MSLAAFARLHPGIDASRLVPGVDVSGWQTPAQLEEALSWARWAYIKATQGLHYYEPDVTAARLAVCRQRNVRYGFYHFANPDRGNSAVAEARFFALAIQGQGGPGTLPPVLDLEAGDGDLDGWALAFLAEIEQQVGRKPMVYSGAGFIDTHLHDARLAAYPLWLAHYASQGADPWVPVGPWSDFTAWQYADATVEHGSLDVNVARPTLFADTLGPASDPEELTMAERAELLAELQAVRAELTSQHEKMDYVQSVVENGRLESHEREWAILTALNTADVPHTVESASIEVLLAEVARRLGVGRLAP